jgi:Sap, sulfolipid-1-addressing protein
VSGEALVLALSGIVRPTTLAAVYTMLSGPRARRLLVAYLAAGLVLSLTVGTVIVVVLQGYTTSSGSTLGRAVVDVVLGAAACGYAAGVWTRRQSEPSAMTERTGAWIQRRLQNLKVTGAALIGVVTHLPGLVYLAALNAIVASAASTTGAVVQVVVYNIIWYSVGIGALVVSAFHPTAARDLLENAQAAIRPHSRTIVVVFFAIVGLYLIGKGLLVLLDR